MTETMKLPPHPLMLQVNARQLLRAESDRQQRPVTLASIHDDTIAEWRARRFDAVWLMGVWRTGEIGRQLSASLPSFTAGHAEVLPDWTEADVCGSPFAVVEYSAAPEFGGDGELAVFRQRLREAGIALVLDFVPNHTARDNPWVDDRPALYIEGSEHDLSAQPMNYARHDGRILAFGRDPYFAGWADTFQLDYRKPATRRHMVDVLLGIADKCDAVRCDVSMLLLRDRFLQTWGGEWQPGDAEDFWAAAIDAVRGRHPGFAFIAEVYWGLEDALQLLGFDFTYDKDLYDHLVHRSLGAVRGRLLADAPDRRHSLHFLENHDEQRAAAALPDPAYRRAAAVLTLALPGARLVHDGQVEGRRMRHSVHLRRRFDEPADGDEVAFFARLFQALGESTVGRGTWIPVGGRATWAAEQTFDNLFAVLWEEEDGRRDLVVVNLSAADSEANLPLRRPGMAGRWWLLQDRLSDEQYRRSGDDMIDPGLFVRLKPHQAQIFSLTREDGA